MCRGWCKYPTLFRFKHRMHWQLGCIHVASCIAMGMVQQVPNADQADEFVFKEPQTLYSLISSSKMGLS